MFSFSKQQLPVNYQFHFQGNEIKANRMWNDSEPINSGPKCDCQLHEGRSIILGSLISQGLVLLEHKRMFSSSSSGKHFNARNSNVKREFLYYSCYLKMHLTIWRMTEWMTDWLLNCCWSSPAQWFLIQVTWDSWSCLVSHHSGSFQSTWLTGWSVELSARLLLDFDSIVVSSFRSSRDQWRWSSFSTRYFHVQKSDLLFDEVFLQLI
jgi:hypothetical protein